MQIGTDILHSRLQRTAKHFDENSSDREQTFQIQLMMFTITCSTQRSMTPLIRTSHPCCCAVQQAGNAEYAMFGEVNGQTIFYLLLVFAHIKKLPLTITCEVWLVHNENRSLNCGSALISAIKMMHIHSLTPDQFLFFVLAGACVLPLTWRILRSNKLRHLRTRTLFSMSDHSYCEIQLMKALSDRRLDGPIHPIRVTAQHIKQCPISIIFRLSSWNL